MRGTSLLELKQAASQLNIHLEGRELSASDLLEGGNPGVLALRNAHFAVYVPSCKAFTIIDPPYSVRVLSESEIKLLWTGKALLVRK